MKPFKFEDLPEHLQILLLVKLEAGSRFQVQIGAITVDLEIPDKELYFSLRGEPFLKLEEAIEKNKEITDYLFSNPSTTYS